MIELHEFIEKINRVRMGLDSEMLFFKQKNKALFSVLMRLFELKWIEANSVSVNRFLLPCEIIILARIPPDHE